MARTEKCIYCGISLDPTKGDGDHIIPVQLGEFRNDVRFRRICPPCNNKIGRSEQQLLQCGPESFLRDIVNPKIPAKRQRGRSQVKTAMGAPTPESTIDLGDHRELVRRTKDKPTNVMPVDQMVIHDDKNREHFFKLFHGMRPEQLKKQVEKAGITKMEKQWLHCDENRFNEFRSLIQKVWPRAEIQQYLPITERGVHQVNGRIKLTVTDHYFRSLAKIGFHYYLARSRRGCRGDENCFAPIRDFIMNGGDSKRFFHESAITFVMPFGKLRSGGVKTPQKWCHWLAADETGKVVVVYIQLFVGRGCVPQPHNITLATIDSHILVPSFTWGHVYLYDDPPGPDRFAGCVEEVQIARVHQP